MPLLTALTGGLLGALPGLLLVVAGELITGGGQGILPIAFLAKASHSFITN